MSLRRIAILVHPDDAETARACLLEAAPAGFEEIDRTTTVELAAYGDDAFAKTLRDLFGDVTVTPVEAGWEDGWRAFHQPVTIAGIWVGPPWLEPPVAHPSVVIDPGRAFGTGAHPTTRLCIELLAKIGGGALLDVGCGSGVLAIAGRRLGFAPVIAVDDDPVAIEVTRENAIRNGVDLETLLLDASIGTLPSCDVVVANITARTVAAVLGRTDARRAVTSGYLTADRIDTSRWQRVERRTSGDWAADLLARS